MHKARYWLLGLVLAGGLAFVACDDNDNGDTNGLNGGDTGIEESTPAGGLGGSS